MLKALYISGAIAVFLVLLSLIKITIAISYVNDLDIFIKIGLLRIKLYPFEQKTPKEKAIKKVKKEKKKQFKARQKPQRPKLSIKEVILLLKDYLYTIIGKFGRYIRLDEYRLKVLVATDDPAKTGVLYGAVCAAASGLSVLVDRIKRKTRKKGMIYTEIKPDFLAEEPELSINVALSMRVWQMFSMGITAAKGFLQYNALLNEKADEKAKRAELANKEQ